MITPDLREKVEETVAAIRAMLDSGKLPPPVNDVRCRECSLKEICQPQAMAAKNGQKALAADLFEVDGE